MPTVKTILPLALLLPLTACSSDEPTWPAEPPELRACAADLFDGRNPDADGVRTYTYQDGFPLHEALDQGLDGVIDETVDHVYVDGRETRWEIKNLDQAGQLVLTMAGEHTYDAEGRDLTSSDDLDGDGVTDHRTTYVRDAAGVLVEIQTDEGADGTIEAVDHLVHVDGVHVRTDVDTGDDGTVDATIVYVRDDAGQLIRREHDTGADGSLERVLTYTYESHGWIESISDDRDNDGAFDRRYTYAYEDARQKSLETLFRVDGTELRWFETYRYDCR